MLDLLLRRSSRTPRHFEADSVTITELRLSLFSGANVMNPLQLPERDIRVLQNLAYYRHLTRAQITRLEFPNDAKGNNKDGRVTRKRLKILLDKGLINRTNCQVFNPNGGSGTYVFYPSQKGCELLAELFDEPRYLSVITKTPDWKYLAHWTSISEFNIRLRQAVALQTEVRVDGWFTEWDTVNPDEPNPAKKYSLFTLIQEQPKRIVCAPDAAFLLSFRGFSKVYFVEIDRGTSGIQQIAAKKTPGYARMGSRHKDIFPATNMDSFSVLNVVPRAGRRDLLRKEIAKKERPDLWKFVSWEDITPESLLFEPITYTCDGGPQPIVKRGPQPVRNQSAAAPREARA